MYLLQLSFSLASEKRKQNAQVSLYAVKCGRDVDIGVTADI